MPPSPISPPTSRLKVPPGSSPSQLHNMIYADGIPYLDAHAAVIKNLPPSLAKNRDLPLMLRAVGNAFEHFDDVDIALFRLIQRNNSLYTRFKTPAEKAAEFQRLLDDLAAITRSEHLADQQRAQIAPAAGLRPRLAGIPDGGPHFGNSTGET